MKVGSDDLTNSTLRRLRKIVGRRHVLTARVGMDRYLRGYRFGGGPALAVVRPGSCLQLWHVLQICIETGAVVIVQAANTGLTGGSTPDGDDYDRPVVVVNTLRLTGIQLLDEGRQVLCLAGATLFQLERTLKRHKREPHSVIGSSCFGASVVGGVCNNSGGSLLQRGPAYTEYAMFASVGVDGKLRLVNNLGLDLGTDETEMLGRIDRGDLPTAVAIGDRAASDSEYASWVRMIDADTPARFNADPRRHYESSGCAGKLVVFAVRLDTFAQASRRDVFYLGTNDPEKFTAIRREVLTRFATLPTSAEYLHRDANDIARRYGRDTFHVIQLLGTTRLPWLFKLKDALARIASRIGLAPGFEERFLQRLSSFLPDPLPPRLTAFHERFEHHLMIAAVDEGIEELTEYLEARCSTDTTAFFKCEGREADAAFLHRFVTAGAAVRYRAVHADEVEDIVAVDVALRRNDEDWTAPASKAGGPVIVALHYGHFFCHVFHRDYIIRKGVDAVAFEHEMWSALDERGAEYPAEHNVGHLYRAKAALAAFYCGLDPTNTLNPGIGQLSKNRSYVQTSAMKAGA